MSKKVIQTVIILLSLSLAGIIGVQFLWIRNAIRIEEKKFDTTINEVLQQVVTNLEQDEAIFFITKRLHSTKETNPKNTEIQKISGFLNKIDQDKKSKKFNSDTHIVISSTNGNTTKFWTQKNLPDSSLNIAVKVTSSDTIIRTLKKEIQIEQILDKVVYEYKFRNSSIEDRIDKTKIFNDLKTILENSGIHSEFNFGIIDNNNNKMVISSDSNLNDQLLLSNFKVNLFPNDIIFKENQLVLDFPNRFSLIYKSIFPLLILSGILTLFIVLTYSNAVFFILRQKKINDIKSDFINNITHEFKTPIATIGLASDSINNSKIIGNPDKIRYFTKIIKDENFRMNKQVENILQLSLFEKHELNLNTQPCNLNEIVQKAADHIELQIIAKEGTLKTNLNALKDKVLIDEIHFLNALFNLLDNAIKYSVGKPEIEIGTRNQDKNILIWVKDKGIGMSSKNQKKIFKKFFRAETGNIHNVKGFGLGLSYVKLITEKHNAKITVISKPNQGSNFEITLPLIS